ncbi:MAG: zinc-binding dehydrogenase [Atopobiaceae bacterium]
MSVKVKGYGMLEVGKVGWIENELLECGPLDAICRPLAVAICSSDVHTLGGAIGPRTNLILGHEAVGEVTEVGSLVKDVHVGDKVIIPAVTPHWGSLAAQTGHSSHSGGMIAAFEYANSKDGVFADHFHVTEADANLAPLPEGKSVEEGCMLSDMVPTGFHGVTLADVQFGDTVLVVGIGPVGLMSVAGSALRGASRIIAVGSRPRCVEAVKGYGATDIVDYHNGDIAEQVMKLTNGEGVDKVVIAGGNVDTFATAVKVVKPAGKIGSVNYISSGDFIKKWLRTCSIVRLIEL